MAPLLATARSRSPSPSASPQAMLLVFFVVRIYVFGVEIALPIIAVKLVDTIIADSEVKVTITVGNPPQADAFWCFWAVPPMF